VITIDFEELRLGFENDDFEVYLDTETGEVITWHEDFPDADEVRDRIDAGFGGRFPTTASRRSYSRPSRATSRSAASRMLCTQTLIYGTDGSRSMTRPWRTTQPHG
jgi:hypothetical protein